MYKCRLFFVQCPRGQFATGLFPMCFERANPFAAELSFFVAHESRLLHKSTPSMNSFLCVCCLLCVFVVAAVECPANRMFLCTQFMFMFVIITLDISSGKSVSCIVSLCCFCCCFVSGFVFGCLCSVLFNSRNYYRNAIFYICFGTCKMCSNSTKRKILRFFVEGVIFLNMYIIVCKNSYCSPNITCARVFKSPKYTQMTVFHIISVCF